MKLDYWYFDNIFNKEQIEELNFFIENNFECFENKEFEATTNDQRIKLAQVKQIRWKKIKHLLHDFEQSIYLTNQENFGFDIYPINDVDFCNLNIYSHENLSHYNWHIDGSINDVYDIKLTILINLSIKEYSGGDFKIFNYGNEHEIKSLNFPGNVVIFKSFLNHKVTPVLKGERRTLALFLKGPKLK